jgi:hypothetical protein
MDLPSVCVWGGVFVGGGVGRGLWGVCVCVCPFSFILIIVNNPDSELDN